MGCHDDQVLCGVYSFAVFDNKNVTSQLIKLYKYGFVMGAGQLLYNLILQNVSEKSFSCVSFEALTVLPLHKKRFAYRGFNQSEILADALSTALGIPKISLMQRTRHTRQQAQLSRADRIENVKDAFGVENEGVAGRTIALVDDVFTSGATLQQAAKALRESGAASVYGITVAHGK
ncbi:ComF family protein [Candidatus Nomurabacteria bacterium]|nr:ComF family protein [Candidatus Nomurabacteria bacterium]